MVHAINKDAFDGHREVNCYTCHRGSAEPVGIPMISGPESKPDAERISEAGETNPPATPTAEQLLDKYVQALGGEIALGKISSRVEKGTGTDAEGRRFAVEIITKAPDQRISVTHMANGDNIASYSGDGGWLSNVGRPPRDMTPAELDSAKLEDDLYLAAHVKQAFQELRVQRPEKVNGRETYIVLGFPEGQPPVQLYFDKESGLLVRMVHYMETALGRNPTQVDYADYREADGVKVPFRWTIARPRGRLAVQVEQLQQNVPVEATKFSKPRAPAASSQNAPSR